MFSCMAGANLTARGTPCPVGDTSHTNPPNVGSQEYPCSGGVSKTEALNGVAPGHFITPAGAGEGQGGGRACLLFSFAG